MSKKQTVKEFIERARSVHGDLYDYSFVEFDGMHKDVTILCKTHGEFKQRPSNHITLKRGCPVCANMKTTGHTRKSLEFYLPRLLEIHGSKYDFSAFVYTNYKTKSVVNCSCGNTFSADMEHMVRGSGCPLCATSGFNPVKPCFFYMIKLDDCTIKCGISIDVKTRLSKLKRKCSSDAFEPLYCVHFENSVLAKNLEDLIKSNFNRLPPNKNLISDGFTEIYSIKDIGDMSKFICEFTTKHLGKFLSWDEVCVPT